MIFRALAFFFLVGSGVSAGELVVHGVAYSEFDAAGHLVRRLKAESASGEPGKMAKLRNGVVEFFAVDDLAGGRIGTLEFQDALYDPTQRIVRGDGHAVLHSNRGDVAGDGFEYNLATNRLRLKSQVVLDRDGVKITGDEGELSLLQAPRRSEILIAEATIKNHVVATGVLDPKLDFDRVTTTSVVYTGTDETLRFAAPMEGWKNGKRTASLEGEISYALRGAAAKPIPPAAGGTSVSPTSKTP